MRTLEKRQGMQSGSPDEAAYQQGWITDVQLRTQAQRFGKTDYGRYLARLLDQKGNLQEGHGKMSGNIAKMSSAHAAA